MPDGLFNERDRPVAPAGLMRRHAKKMKGIGVVRLGGQDLPVDPLGLRNSPRLMMRKRRRQRRPGIQALSRDCCLFRRSLPASPVFPAHHASLGA